VTNSPRTFRRFIPLLVAGTLAVSACGGSGSTFSSSNDAFSVNGRSYSKADFETITQALVDLQQFVETNGKVKTEDARSIIQTLVRYQAFEQFIEERGITISEEERAKVAEQASADETYKKSPPLLQELLVNLNLASTVLQNIESPSEAELKALYEKAPASSGALCLSHILVKTKEEALAVLKDLDSGVKFADEAAKKSIEPGADKSGGSLANNGEKCTALTRLQQDFDKDFMAGAVAAKMGVPSGPVKSSFGYHIILHHNYADVKASLTKVLSSDAGSNLLAGFMTTSEVTINSVYGTWNDGTAGFN
jgi:parvulin-like peptidyl-prolyl isomerase